MAADDGPEGREQTVRRQTAAEQAAASPLLRALVDRYLRAPDSGKADTPISPPR